MHEILNNQEITGFLGRSVSIVRSRTKGHGVNWISWKYIKIYDIFLSFSKNNLILECQNYGLA
jgi:hypothetical protein